MSTIRLSVSGMRCAGCVASVEKALLNTSGVTAANVSLAEHTATVEGNASAEALIGALVESGYGGAELKDGEDEDDRQSAEQAHYQRLLRKSAAAAVIGGALGNLYDRIRKFAGNYATAAGM